MNGSLPPKIADFVTSANVSLTVALPGGKDRVLVAANPAFRRMTGYEESEILGRDCRFLQGEATTDEAKSAMRRFFDDNQATQTRISIINYRKSGEPFVNLVFLSKLCGLDRVPRFLFASQFDVSHANTGLADIYDRDLSENFSKLNTLARSHALGVETSLQSIASSAHAIAAAKLALAELETR